MQTCSETVGVLLVHLKLSVILRSDGLGLGMTPQCSLKAVGMISRYVLEKCFFFPLMTRIAGLFHAEDQA